MYYWTNTLLIKNKQRECFLRWDNIKCIVFWMAKKALFAFISYSHCMLILYVYASLEKRALPLCDLIQKSDSKHSLFWYLISDYCVWKQCYKDMQEAHCCL